ncbi:MAG: single-stranded DNA-binding protein [Bacteroidetes bacterium]|jgi:single-strand DNA-binding protein|nr:single-stranded DNA-binding protein [Candidatus Woesearchaeota archaeon]MBT3799639.1 single-stranded DNA-binding protein [Bacteroidota bacterium]MBT5528082.1 single-stranded DNA-binding protein [Cytophagia bacterium]MBT4338720.1 single-stranded DNA-binding protein [Bacteroidota bacterium]MBT4728285.1 single-stranded DNA-binding protein [Bacteroidota bacterium]
MNTLRNRVQLIGNLGANPEIRDLSSGKKVARFSLATTDSYRDKEGNQVKETQWHNIIAWNKSAEFAEKYLEKGKRIAIDGKLTTRNWEDTEGKKHYVTEVILNEVMMLDKKE